MEIKGRDLTAPRRRMTLEGVTYELAFNNRSARIAEDVYADVYGVEDERGGYMAILGEASRGRLRALQAIYYGALIAGGATMPWDNFDRVFTLDSIEGVKEIIMAAVSDSLPPDDGKNMESQPGTDGPGAG